VKKLVKDAGAALSRVVQVGNPIFFLLSIWNESGIRENAMSNAFESIGVCHR